MKPTGNTRTVQWFTWFPRKLNTGKWVWLKIVNLHQEENEYVMQLNGYDGFPDPDPFATSREFLWVTTKITL